MGRTQKPFMADTCHVDMNKIALWFCVLTSNVTGSDVSSNVCSVDRSPSSTTCLCIKSRHTIHPGFRVTDLNPTNILLPVKKKCGFAE